MPGTLWIATHHHRHGHDTILLLSEETPTEDEIVKAAQLDFEPERDDEWIEVAPASPVLEIKPEVQRKKKDAPSGPTPGPYLVERLSGTGSFELWADHRSRAVERWAKEDPERKSSFNSVSVCRTGVMFNGGGKDCGPGQLIDLEEVAANVAMLRAAPELLEALEAEETAMEAGRKFVRSKGAAREKAAQKAQKARRRADELRASALSRARDIDPAWLVQRKD